MHTLAHIQYRDHNVHITRNEESGHIVCFKYNDVCCDFTQFNPNEHDQCAEYIMDLLPNIVWAFKEDH